MTGRVFGWLGIKDGVGLVETGVEGLGRSVDVMAIDRPDDLGDIAALGLAQSKRLVALVQQEIVTAQSRDPAAAVSLLRNRVPGQGYRPHQIATLFGQVTLRLPRFRCAGCGGAEAAGQHIAARYSTRSGRSFPPVCLTGSRPACSNTFCRSMPGATPRPCTLKVGEELRDAAPAEPATAAAAITLTLDPTFIRSCEDGQRHLELGNVETAAGRFSPRSPGLTPQSRC